MEAVLHAIGDASRRQLLDMLRQGPSTAGALAERLPIARPGVSRHLRVLREAGLVQVEARGQERLYSLRPETLADLDDWLAGYRVLWTNRMDALHTEIARGNRAGRSSP